MLSIQIVVYTADFGTYNTTSISNNNAVVWKLTSYYSEKEIARNGFEVGNTYPKYYLKIEHFGSGVRSDYAFRQPIAVLENRHDDDTYYRGQLKIPRVWW